MADGCVSMPGEQGSCLVFENLDARMRPHGISVVQGSDIDRRPAVVKDVGNELPGLNFSIDVCDDEEAKREAKRQQRKRDRKRYGKEHNVPLLRELHERLLDFDPKQGGKYYPRMHHVNLVKFDLDEESPLGPMRFTDAVYKDKGDYHLTEAINIFSMKIACSDVGFPIRVFGTVIARDSIDGKCIYLFNRDRDHCQIINSEDESLVLTGPKRGLAVLDDNYIETYLMIRDQEGQDRELSKGLITIWGTPLRSLEECVLESKSLATRLSTVDVTYGFVVSAVEATIAIEVTQGHFDGQITAHTTSIANRMVLHDRELYGDTVTGDGRGVIHLKRPVVSVSVKEMLVIVVKTRDGKSERQITFTPKVNGGEEDVITVGDDIKMRVKVTWSIMNF